jgi:hypothetical protein
MTRGGLSVPSMLHAKTLSPFILSMQPHEQAHHLEPSASLRPHDDRCFSSFHPFARFLGACRLSTSVCKFCRFPRAVFGRSFAHRFPVLSSLRFGGGGKRSLPSFLAVPREPSVPIDGVSLGGEPVWFLNLRCTWIKQSGFVHIIGEHLLCDGSFLSDVCKLLLLLGGNHAQFDITCPSPTVRALCIVQVVGWLPLALLIGLRTNRIGSNFDKSDPHITDRTFVTCSPRVCFVE